MKYTAAVAALLGNVRADAPPYFNEPPFAVSTHPAAAGLIQLQSACAQSGVAGVMCAPANNQLFATGMNGDEDLGEDITMKGNKFHFNQAPQALFATGMNGDEDLGEDITMKGNKFHFNQFVQMQDEPAGIHKADWTGYTFPDKVHTVDPKEAQTHTAFY